ncbi:UPF0481 protein [Camellia lanceoleosa]|uniref:UPF0481 protein n=1 Tax=Camellia lanceoleosa TaxID=1840588 RepID=A0ACC0GB72_9ERIC|nr:UPF0481 protein [Camellia lanceoleosa]
MSNDNQAHKKSKPERKRDDWIISITNKLAKVEKPSQLSIYKVPDKLLKLKKDAYTPSIVSVGPFHHNNKAMQAFEKHKQQYLLHLFKRTSQAALSTLKDCATAILKFENAARRCYSEEICLDEYELAEILLVDGCFLLELFLKYSNIENHEENTVGDPLINDAQTIATLRHDLALLENQIPFFVLKILFDEIKYCVPELLQSSSTEPNVATLALLFFKLALGLSNEAIQSKSSKLSGTHLLDILRNFYLPKCETLDISELRISHKIPQSRDLQRSGLRDCATRLSKAGIRFAANTADANENLLEINFSATGLVTMPPLHIQEAITETIFRNLIAFEQHGGTGSTSHHIASYVFLMRSLLHSSDDVGILHKEGIIKNEFSDGGGGGEGVTSLFESLCNGVVLNDFYFSKLCEDVNGYYYDRVSRWHWRRLYLNLDDSWRTTKHKWHEYMLDLFSVYLKNPWTTLKVIAAVLLLIFTALQTYYTILSYFK